MLTNQIKSLKNDQTLLADHAKCKYVMVCSDVEVCSHAG